MNINCHSKGSAKSKIFISPTYLFGGKGNLTSMAPTSFHGLFDIHSTSNSVASPPATHPKWQDQGRQPPSSIKLQDYASRNRSDGPSDSTSSAQVLTEQDFDVHLAKDNDANRTPNDLEMSRPPSPMGEDAANQMQRWNDPPMNKWRVLSCCFIYFGSGMNDSGMSMPPSHDPAILQS